MSTPTDCVAQRFGRAGTRWMQGERDRDDEVRALLDAVACGDVKSFENLYVRYERRAYRYALTFVRDSASAEQIVVDSMLAVWNGAVNYNRSARASTWILGIVRHKALDAVRQQQRLKDNVSLDLAGEIPDAARGPYESANDRSVGELMRKAMLLLSEDHREILFLTFYEELSYEEIGRLLSIPQNTVKTRVHYAKLKLRKHFVLPTARISQ